MRIHIVLNAVLALLVTNATGGVAAEERANIVIALADDLGYGDLACYGHPVIQTPHLDRFAGQGLRLTNCYAAAANCSPARTGLMTGRTPFRVGIHNWIPMFSPMHVRRSEITVATLLRSAGYATCQVGKWHLNGEFNMPSQPQPGDHGFDHWFATQNNALPNHENPDNFVRNGEAVGPLTGFSAQLVVDEAVRWLTEERDQAKPFFLYLCFHEPHEPIATDERFRRLYADGDEPSRAAHHGNVTQMDHAFGRLLDALDRLDLTSSTFVFFTSDNGPAITRRHPHGSSGPLREKKGHLYEGGIRVPGIVRWPRVVSPGQVCHVPVSGVDVLPTLCELARVPVPNDRALDGTSFLPILQGRPLRRSTPLYWQFNRASSQPKVALRRGDWKILASLTGAAPQPGADLIPAEMQTIKSAALRSFELYNLRDDIGETTDLARRHPETLAEMEAALRRLYNEVRDESPIWPAWQWPRYESQRIHWGP